MLAITMAITKVKCRKCGHEWLPRSEKKPKLCPECGRATWDEGGSPTDDEDSQPPSLAEIRRWMPAELLKRADAISEKLGLSFGELVTQGLEERLKQIDKDKTSIQKPSSRSKNKPGELKAVRA